MAMLISNVCEESKLNTSLLQSDRSQRGKKGSKGVLSFLSLQTLENHSKSFNLSLIATFTNSVTELKPCFPMAFFSISSVRDLGILRDMLSLSAIGDEYCNIDLCTLCGIYERYKATCINNTDQIPHIILNNSSNRSFIWRNGERDGRYERESNN